MRYTSLFLFLWIMGCGSPGSISGTEQKNQLKKEIENIATELEVGDMTKVDTSKANLLIEKSLNYVEAFPNDTLSPLYLFRAADVSIGLDQHEQGILLWEKLRIAYPQHERAATALFFQGLTADNELSDKERSASYYQKFLTQYPDHRLAAQAKLLLEQLSLSPEELIRQFKAREGI